MLPAGLMTGAAGTSGRTIADALTREGETPFRTDLRSEVGQVAARLHDVTMRALIDGRALISALMEGGSCWVPGW